MQGYNFGYINALNERERNSQLLAGAIVPYELGNSKWKGFIMGFPEGYNDGYSAKDQ